LRINLNKLSVGINNVGLSTTDIELDYRPRPTNEQSSRPSISMQGNTAPPLGRSWADAVAYTPTTRGAYGGGGATTDADNETDNQDRLQDQERYQLFNGKRRKLRSPGQDLRPMILSTTRAKLPVKPKPKTVVGSNDSCTLKAARELKNNRIFAVSNLNKDTTCEQLLKFLKDSGIKVNTVFEAKTKFENSSSFRVNIEASDAEKINSKNLWGSHILIRDWVFKAQPKD